MTGVPCPTCGATRGVVHLLGGRVVDAFLMNPGIAIFAIGLVVYLVRTHLAYRATGVWSATPPRDAAQRRRLSWIVGIAVFTNWIYVVWHEAALAAGGRLM